jgi:hypothetical protein
MRGKENRSDVDTQVTGACSSAAGWPIVVTGPFTAGDPVIPGEGMNDEHAKRGSLFAMRFVGG